MLYRPISCRTTRSRRCAARRAGRARRRLLGSGGRRPPASRRGAGDDRRASSSPTCGPDFGIAAVRVGNREVAGDRGGGARPALRPAAALRQGHRHAAAAGAGRGAALGPFRHAAARHGRDPAARPRRLHHRLDERPRRAARGRPLRRRRLYRLSDPLPRGDRPGRARAGGLPALRAGAGGRRGDVGGPQPRHAALDDADGRPDRRPREPDGGERAGDRPSRSPGSSAR